MTDDTTPSVYTTDDARHAPEGHFYLVGTDIEIVAYRTHGDDLALIVNRGKFGCVYRETLPGIFAPDFQMQWADYFVDERHRAHRHLDLMREYIDHHPIPPWRRFLRRWFRWA